MGAGWRPLGAFWLAVLVAAGGGAATLQALGPAHAPAPDAAPPVAASAAPAAVADPPAVAASSPAPPSSKAALGLQPALGPPAPGPSIRPRTLSGAALTPDPALLEPAPDFPGLKLPRIGPDGRTSIRTYARPFDQTDRRPRLAMLVVGLGLDIAASRMAIQTLPPAISLGVSPYTHDPDALLDEVRARGHEFFVTLPMESQGYPLNDGGPRQLISSADPVDNARNLEWDLSRMQGEVGITGASDGLRGERFAASSSAIGAVLREAARRGLLYVDPRPNTAMAGSIGVTSVVDDGGAGGGGADIEAKLAALEQQARNAGPALGLALRPTPVTVEHIAAWARGLDGRGIALVPVSALAPR